MSQARKPVVNASRVIAASRALTAPEAHACDNQAFVVVAENGKDRVETLHARKAHRFDEVDSTGELQERAEVRHHPEQRGSCPSTRQRFEKTQHAGAIGAVKVTDPCDSKNTRYPLDTRP